MNVLGVSKLFELSKQAKKSKNYALEKNYLNQALSLAPTNTKLINALIRNLRREGNHSELKKWLETLYTLKQDGRILFELMQIEQREKNFKTVGKILLENERIDPNSKKIKKRIQKNSKREKILINNNPLFTLPEEEAKLIQNVRDFIYSETDFSSKYNWITNNLESQSEEIILSIMAELYISSSFDTLARNLVKKYKRGLNPEIDVRKTKLANKLLELVLNKKVRKYNWDNFWRTNLVILPEEKRAPKVLVKSALENK